jgi:hypothetical protein
MVAGVSEQDDDDKRRERHQRGMASGAGAVIGVVLGGPVGAVVGTALGPFLEPWAAKVWEEFSADGRRRAGEALAAACEALDCEPEELGERIAASELTRLQAGIAISAATRTVWPTKVRVLGQALASGLLAEDDAKIDTEMLILAAMAEIEARDLSLLELLNGHNSRGWTKKEIGLHRPHLKFVLRSMLGTLQRHGLIMQDDIAIATMTNLWEEIERREPWRDDAPLVLDTGRFVDLAPDQSWSVTDLGWFVLGRYREAGADLPDGWAPSKPDASGAS